MTARGWAVSQDSGLIHCPECGQPFVEQRAMKSHKVQTHERHWCPAGGCQQTFETVKGLKIHHTKVHDRSLPASFHDEPEGK